MTTAKLIEYRITRQLLQRRADATARQSDIQPWADRVIAILAVTTGLLIVGSYFEELLWVVLATATAYTLR